MGVSGVLRGIFGSWTVQQAVTIEDLRLGFLFWSLRIIILVYVIVTMFGNYGYMKTDTPSGYPTFWFESGGLYTEQNRTDQVYCNNPDYNYYMSDQDQYYWNNDAMACYNLNYGEVVSKNVKYGFAATIMKRSVTNTVACSGGTDPCTSLAGNPGSRSFTRRVGNACTCEKQQDYFVAGVEYMELVLEHTFITKASFDQNEEGDPLEGSSSQSSSGSGKKTVKTCIEQSGSSECYKEFAAGEPIKFTIKEWLELAGLDLDGRVTSRIAKDVRSGILPQRRSTGVKVHVTMSYEGTATQDEIVCKITVKGIDGWNSIGSTVQYLEFGSQTSNSFNDDYKMGISFEFFPTGVIRKIDPQAALATIIAGLVLLRVCDTVVSFVAFKIVPEKNVYMNAQCGKLSYERSLAKFGVSTALACSAFKEWDQRCEAGKEPSLTKAELASVFEGPFNKETSAMLANCLTEQVGKDELVAHDLVDLMGDGLVSIDGMKVQAEKLRKRGLAAALNKVLPATGQDPA